MSVVFHTRTELGLAVPNPARLSVRTAKLRGVTVHWVGMPTEPAKPAVTWLDLQTQAMNGNNVNHTQYGDIEYNAGACESIAHPGNGSLFEGRDPKWNGAHAISAGQEANDTTLGIAVIGDLSAGVIQALEAYIYLAVLSADHSVPFSLQGHREWEHDGGIATDCPGDHIEAWLTSYRAQHGFVVL